MLFFIIIATFAFTVYWLFFRISFSEGPFKYAQIGVEKTPGGPYLVQNGLPYHTGFDELSRTNVPLTKDWRFNSGDGTHEDVTLPHSYNVVDSPLMAHIGKVCYTRVVNRTEVIDLALAKGERVHLVIEGAFYEMMVEIDHSEVGHNRGGFLPFRVDVTDYLKASTSIQLKITLDNTPTSTSMPPLVYPGHPQGFHPYGGLHKPVYLEIMPKTYLFKCHVTPRAKENVIEVTAMWHSEYSSERLKNCSIRLKDREKRIQHQRQYELSYKGSVGWIHIKVPMEEVRLWSPKDPYLYELTVMTVDEVATVCFGFSHPYIHQGKIMHNGIPIKLQGVCRHEEDRYMGQAQTHEQMDQDLALVKDLNMNYIRLTHYPHEPYFLSACDREGIYLWEEIPLYQAGLAPIKYLADKSTTRKDPWYVKSFRTLLMFVRTKQFTDPKVLSNAYDDLVRMIERDYNHPSILFWGIGNECWTLNPAGQKALKHLRQVAESMDSRRIPAYAAMTIPGLTGIFERSFDEMPLIGINEYFGWYYGVPEDAGKLLWKLHHRYPDKPILVTETGADAAYGLEGRFSEKGSTEAYQKDYLEAQLRILKDVPGFSGFSIWVLKDFLCPEYGTDNPVPFYNLKGLVTRDYEKKEAYEAVKAILAETDKEKVYEENRQRGN